MNKPGCDIDDLKGGVAGGSILNGVLKLGDEIEIRPGIVSRDETGKVKCRPIFSRVVSLFAEHNDLKFAVPGGLIGVGTRIDPTLTRADRYVKTLERFPRFLERHKDTNEARDSSLIQARRFRSRSKGPTPQDLHGP